MRFSALFLCFCLLLSSCTVYRNNLKSGEINQNELDKLKVDDKVFVAIKGSMTSLNGYFHSLKDDELVITKKAGSSDLLNIPIDSIDRIRFDKNKRASTINTILGVGVSVLAIGVFSFLHSGIDLN